MAHGGPWNAEQCVFLMVMKLSTNLPWKDIAVKFREYYGTPTTHKDCESKYNKDLKNTTEKDIWVRFTQTTEIWTAQEEKIVAFAMTILGQVDNQYRLI